MEIKKTSEENIDIISLSGHLDGSTAPVAQEEIMPVLVDKVKIILDMSNCEYVSSAGLRFLLVVAKTLKTKQGKGVLCGLIPEVKDVMEMTGFDKMYDDYGNLQDAINALKEAG